MALMWRCDLCNAQSDEPLWRGLIWSHGINRRLASGVRKMLTPDRKADLCDDCVDTLAEKMRRRGAPGNVGGGASGSRGCAPKCVQCGEDAEGVLRIVPPGSESWHKYTYTGTFCGHHLAPFRSWGRETRTYGQRRVEVVEIRRLRTRNGEPILRDAVR